MPIPFTKKKVEGAEGAENTPPAPDADAKATPPLPSEEKTEPTGTVDGGQVSNEEDKENVDYQEAAEDQEEKDIEQDARNKARYKEEAKQNEQVSNDRTGRHSVPKAKPIPAPEEEEKEADSEDKNDEDDKPAEEVRE